jgi:hypothetical protein
MKRNHNLHTDVFEIATCCFWSALGAFKKGDHHHFCEGGLSELPWGYLFCFSIMCSSVAHETYQDWVNQGRSLMESDF